MGPDVEALVQRMEEGFYDKEDLYGMVHASLHTLREMKKRSDISNGEYSDFLISLKELYGSKD